MSAGLDLQALRQNAMSPRSPFSTGATNRLGSILRLAPSFWELLRSCQGQQQLRQRHASPRQPAPYNAFPYIALAIVATAAVITFVVARRNPTTGSGKGTTFAGSWRLGSRSSLA